MTPLQFITQLETHLPRLVSETRIDYFGITAISHQILKRIRAALIAETDYPGSKTAANRVGVALMVASVMQRALIVKKATKGDFDGGSTLLLVRDVFEKALKQKYRETGGDINDLLDQNVSVSSEDGIGRKH